MSSTPTPDPSLAALHEDVAALKRDLAALLSHLKPGGEPVETQAERLFQAAADEGSKAAKVAADQLARQVEQQPLLSVLIALGVGYIGGRLLSR